VSVRDWTIVVAVVFWGAFVVAASYALLKLVGLLEEATRDLREGTDRILPTLEQVNETAAGVNVQLARFDTIVAGVQSITHTTDQLAGVVHAAISNPLIKAAAFATGTAKAARTLRDAPR
jgi:methyl-accepting chemotaxis protein